MIPHARTPASSTGSLRISVIESTLIGCSQTTARFSNGLSASLVATLVAAVDVPTETRGMDDEGRTATATLNCDSSQGPSNGAPETRPALGSSGYWDRWYYDLGVGRGLPPRAPFPRHRQLRSSTAPFLGLVLWGLMAPLILVSKKAGGDTCPAETCDPGGSCAPGRPLEANESQWIPSRR